MNIRMTVAGHAISSNLPSATDPVIALDVFLKVFRRLQKFPMISSFDNAEKSLRNGLPAQAL
jgi:hypothetical protein